MDSTSFYDTNNTSSLGGTAGGTERDGTIHSISSKIVRQVRIRRKKETLRSGIYKEKFKASKLEGKIKVIQQRRAHEKAKHAEGGRKLAH